MEPEVKVAVIDEANANIHQRGFIGGFYIRPMSISCDGVHDGHAHWIDHVSNILTPLKIEWRNIETGETGVVICRVPCKVLVKAKVWHKFSVLEGYTEARWECWFSQAEAEAKYDTPVPWHLEEGMDPLPIEAATRG